MNITLFQFETCPFCIKVRNFMNQHKIAYEIIEVDRANKPEEVTSTGGTVPVIYVDGEVISDSSRIIAWLEEHVVNK
jgi:glutathione S-transferase